MHLSRRNSDGVGFIPEDRPYVEIDAGSQALLSASLSLSSLSCACSIQKVSVACGSFQPFFQFTYLMERLRGCSTSLQPPGPMIHVPFGSFHAPSNGVGQVNPFPFWGSYLSGWISSPLLDYLGVGGLRPG